MKKIKIILLFFISLMALNINNVCAFDIDGSNSDGNSSQVGACGDGQWCWINTTYGVRFSIYDKNGNLVGKAVDILYSGSTSSYSNVPYNRINSTSISGKVLYYYWYHNGPNEWLKDKRNNNDIAGTEMVAQLLWDYNRGSKEADNALKMIEVTSSNYSETVDKRIKKLSKDNFDKVLKILGNLGLENISPYSDYYLVVEPTTLIKKGSNYYYGTAIDLYNMQLKDAIKDKESGANSVMKALADRLGNAMFTTKKILLSAASAGTNAREIKNWKTYAYGMATYKINDIIPSNCNLADNKNGKATEKETNYWTYWDETCNQDGDENIEGCWRKIKGGCCETYITENPSSYNDVRSLYPDCFVEECTPKNKLPDAPVCGDAEIKLLSERNKLKDGSTIPTECLATSSYYVFTNGNWRVGCKLSDQLILPKQYSSDVSLNSFFVWPTHNKILQYNGVGKNLYPVKRTSSASCLVYQYDSQGRLSSAKNITQSFFNGTVETFKKLIEGELKITYNGNEVGELKNDSNYKIEDSKIQNGTLYFKLLYGYEPKTIPSKSYIYRDKETSEYLKKITKDKYKYELYEVPILPLTEKNKIFKYGVDYSDVSFSRIDSYSGSYSCEIKTNDTSSKPCICDDYSDHPNKDITGLIETNSTEKVARCNYLKNQKPGPCYGEDGDCEYCYCFSKNNLKIDLTDCVQEKMQNGNSMEKSINICTKLELRCDSQIIDLSDKIIYRTIYLNNPFLSKNGSIRKPGSNWGGKYSISGTKYKEGSVVEQYITGTADKVYKDDVAMYSFVLTPKLIKEIRQYNKDNDYDDFELSCSGLYNDNKFSSCGTYLLSNPLRNNDSFSSAFVGGTCKTYANAKAKGNDDCRIKALES